jgi:hypothetical protein
MADVLHQSIPIFFSQVSAKCKIPDQQLVSFAELLSDDLKQLCLHTELTLREKCWMTFIT